MLGSPNFDEKTFFNAIGLYLEGWPMVANGLGEGWHVPRQLAAHSPYSECELYPISRLTDTYEPVTAWHLHVDDLSLNVPRIHALHVKSKAKFGKARLKCHVKVLNAILLNNVAIV